MNYALSVCCGLAAALSSLLLFRSLSYRSSIASCFSQENKFHFQALFVFIQLFSAPSGSFTRQSRKELNDDVDFDSFDRGLKEKEKVLPSSFLDSSFID